jgi:hypothetical protein
MIVFILTPRPQGTNLPACAPLYAIFLRERSKRYGLIVLPLLIAASSRNGTAQTLNNNKHNPLKAAHTILTSEHMTFVW